LNVSNGQLTSSKKLLAEELDVSKKDLAQEKQKTKTQADRIKALEAQLATKSAASSGEWEVLRAENLAL
jgi:BMFP domain-containing protein YqiC